MQFCAPWRVKESEFSVASLAVNSISREVARVQSGKSRVVACMQHGETYLDA